MLASRKPPRHVEATLLGLLLLTALALASAMEVSVSMPPTPNAPSARSLCTYVELLAEDGEMRLVNVHARLQADVVDELAIYSCSTPFSQGNMVWSCTTDLEICAGDEGDITRLYQWQASAASGQQEPAMQTVVGGTKAPRFLVGQLHYKSIRPSDDASSFTLVLQPALTQSTDVTAQSLISQSATDEAGAAVAANKGSLQNAGEEEWHVADNEEEDELEAEEEQAWEQEEEEAGELAWEEEEAEALGEADRNDEASLWQAELEWELNQEEEDYDDNEWEAMQDEKEAQSVIPQTAGSVDDSREGEHGPDTPASSSVATSTGNTANNKVFTILATSALIASVAISLALFVLHKMSPTPSAVPGSTGQHVGFRPLSQGGGTPEADVEAQADAARKHMSRKLQEGASSKCV